MHNYILPINRVLRLLGKSNRIPTFVRVDLKQLPKDVRGDELPFKKVSIVFILEFTGRFITQTPMTTTHLV